MSNWCVTLFDETKCLGLDGTLYRMVYTTEYACSRVELHVMNTVNHLELILPATVWPDLASREAIWRDLPLPALAQLYGKAAKQSSSAELAGLIGERYALPSLAVAPQLLSSLSQPIEAGYWLCVDPVSLRVDRDHLTVLGEPYLAVTQAEADALVQALNALYQPDGYCFFAATPHRWFVRLPQNPQLEFTPIKAALGRNLNTVLPRGVAALQFNALLNEIQMLLYGHPVNDARDQAGQMLINSLWLWGGGEYPPAVLPQAVQPILGQDELLQALNGAVSVPQSWAELAGANATVLLEDLETHAIYGAGYEWQQAWLRWERDWFAPALAALKVGQLQQLTLHFPDAVERAVIRKTDLWRFWRKADLPRHLNHQSNG